MNKYDLVISEISKVRKTTTGNRSQILCPFHSERTPSGVVYHNPADKDPGSYWCFGCGKHARWNELAEVLGLQKFEWSKPSARTPFDMTPLIDGEGTDDFTLSELPDGKKWRGFPTAFLKLVGCKLATRYGRRFIYLPVIVGEERRGYLLARMQKEDGAPSYLNSKGSWSRDYGLFPYHYVAALNPRVVVLVEGSRDALRLLHAGIPALAILGTQAWSDKKTRTLELLGAHTVVLCFDGDCAGLAAVDKVARYCKSMFEVVNFSLAGKDSPYAKFRHLEEPTKAAKAAGTELWDACNMPVTKLRQLKLLVKAHSA